MRTEIPFAIKGLRRNHAKKIVNTTIKTGPHDDKIKK
jgi:hypothetical protein